MVKNRILHANEFLKKNRKKAFVCYLSTGFPNLKETEKVIDILLKNNVDYIELGLPFSDPIADGPTIQRSSSLALKNGITIKKYFNFVKKIRRKTNTPLIMMTYYNPIFKYGIDKFAKDASLAGIDGVIVPDLPPEESAILNKTLAKKNIYQIFLISPLTKEKRIKKIANMSKGFIYYVSLAGVTGARNKLANDLNKKVRLIKKHTSTPVFVGFGISKPEHVKKINKIADGVIVGSAIIKIMFEQNKKGSKIKIDKFLKSMIKN